jgi:amidase
LSSAFVPHDLGEPIRGAEEGPLAGLTVAVKDMYDIAGERTGGGSTEWLAAQRPAAKTSACVQSLLDDGATIVGKTICDEFFFSLSGANAHYGTPTNPRAVGRLPGGSSSGSASAVGAGACDVALGSDTGGSIRVPGSFCGIYGLRPTHGRTDLTDAMAMAPTFDVAGWFASSPGTFRKVGSVLLTGAAQHHAIERMLIAADAFAQADGPVIDTLRASLARATAQLPKGNDTVIAANGFDEWRSCFRAIQGREIWSIYGEWITANRPALGPGIRERMEYASTVTATDALVARKTLEKLRAYLRERIAPGTILALPTAPCIAPRIDEDAASLDRFRARAMALTSLAGVSGLPQVTLPAGLVDGCPVGLSFIGWAGADEDLLDLAVALARYLAGPGGGIGVGATKDGSRLI